MIVSWFWLFVAVVFVVVIAMLFILFCLLLMFDCVDVALVHVDVILQ